MVLSPPLLTPSLFLPNAVCFPRSSIGTCIDIVIVRSKDTLSWWLSDLITPKSRLIYGSHEESKQPHLIRDYWPPRVKCSRKALSQKLQPEYPLHNHEYRLWRDPLDLQLRRCLGFLRLPRCDLTFRARIGVPIIFAIEEWLVYGCVSIKFPVLISPHCMYPRSFNHLPQIVPSHWSHNVTTILHDSQFFLCGIKPVLNHQHQVIWILRATGLLDKAKYTAYNANPPGISSTQETW